MHTLVKTLEDLKFGINWLIFVRFVGFKFIILILKFEMQFKILIGFRFGIYNEIEAKV